jgi:hypothetical protein
MQQKSTSSATTRHRRNLSGEQKSASQHGVVCHDGIGQGIGWGHHLSTGCVAPFAQSSQQLGESRAGCSPVCLTHGSKISAFIQAALPQPHLHTRNILRSQSCKQHQPTQAESTHAQPCPWATIPWQALGAWALTLVLIIVLWVVNSREGKARQGRARAQVEGQIKKGSLQVKAISITPCYITAHDEQDV